jgi:hypothetical protein
MDWRTVPGVSAELLQRNPTLAMCRQHAKDFVHLLSDLDGPLIPEQLSRRDVEKERSKRIRLRRVRLR